MENTKVGTKPVADIMTTDIFKVTPDTSIKEVDKLFAKRKIRHAPVVDEDKLVGIVSLTDVQRMSFRDAYSDDPDVDLSIVDMFTVGQVMKEKPVTVSSSDPIIKAAEILTTAEFHALPVVDGDKLVGIVTTTDIIKYLVSKI